MTRSTIRRAAVSPVGAGQRAARRTVAGPLAGAALALAAGLLLAGCSVGQVTETARKSPSVPGANAERQLRDADGKVIGSVAVRDVVVAYNNPTGYQRGGDAPLEARVFNDTRQAVTVRVTIAEPEDPDGAASEQLIGAASVALVGGAAPSATELPAPAASFGIPAGGFVVLSPASGRYLRLTGLRDRLLPGMSVPVLFQFSNGLELSVTAPVTNPLSPPDRATPDAGESPGGH